MKKLSILIVMILVTSSHLLAQKADRKDTLPHSAFYSPSFMSGSPSQIDHQTATLSQKERMKLTPGAVFPFPVQLSIFQHDSKKCPQCGRPMNLSAKEQMKAEVMRMYTCPMHPHVPLDKNGRCSQCKAS